MALTQLQFEILNAMMDDYEDVEPVYLTINREFLESRDEPNYGQLEYRLVLVIDEIRQMLEAGLIKAHISCDENIAPLSQPNQAALHYYWFAPTDRGKDQWKIHRG
jgi:hypothetical protein